MKKILTIVAALMMAVTTMQAKHEIGGIVGGLNGLSYKYWFNDNMALQADLAVGLSRGAARSGGYGWDFGFWDFTINPNFLYHWQLPANFKIYTGGGINFGMMSNLAYSGYYGVSVDGKFGINAVVGAAYHFANVPLVLAFDFRPGYGLDFRDANTGALSFFDWKLAFAVRYAF